MSITPKEMLEKGRMMTTEQINKMEGIQEVHKEIKTQKALRNGRSRF
jgi:hypothetical protein